MTEPLHSPWLTLTDAADYVRRGPRFVRAEVMAGRLRAARIGGRQEILTRREWLDEWVEELARPVMVSPRTGFRR
jgi:excisionase family DNA binding protein